MVNFVWREGRLDCRCLRRPKKHLFAVWILRCISRLTSFVGVFRDPRYTNSLTTSKCRRICISRSRGKALDSFYNRVYRYLYTGHNTPSVQLLGSVSLVQACWITACNASTRLGPSFFNSSTAIESAPAALFFLGFSAPLLFPQGAR
jgi:hypothetical protein